MKAITPSQARELKKSMVPDEWYNIINHQIAANLNEFGFAKIDKLTLAKEALLRGLVTVDISEDETQESRTIKAVKTIEEYGWFNLAFEYSIANWSVSEGEYDISFTSKE